MLVRIGEDRPLAVHDAAVDDEDRDLAGAGGSAELCARFRVRGDLVDGVGEAKLGQALAYPSWFSDLAYNFFKNNNISLVWNQLDIIQTPPVVTSDFVYIRLIGDRSIHESDFGSIQRDRIQEMAKWADRLKEIQKYERNVKMGMVAPNNHYAGFGPSTSNAFREMLGLNPVEWGIDKDLPTKVEFEEVRDHKKRPVKQTSLSDFIPK